MQQTDEFNDTDVDISCGQLELFLDEYDAVPYRVIQFLTSYINYGGRVTDAIDLRTSTFNKQKPLLPSMTILAPNALLSQECYAHSFSS
jgi:hypothetical protein